MANVLMTRIAKKPRKVKPRKSKPRIKKKKALTPKQRSRAAKRGWQTRKRKERELLKRIKEGKATQLAAEPALEGMQAVRAYQVLHRMQGKLPEGLDAEATEAVQLWIDEQIKDYVKDYFVDADDDTVIRARLYAAEEAGRFEEEVTRISEEYNMAEHEVYTLWLSP